MKLDSNLIIVTTTSDERQKLEQIALSLVEERLAACVQLEGPVTSRYMWLGKCETSEEWKLVIKTSLDVYNLVERTILELHNYEVPQIVAVPIIGGSLTYQNWMLGNIIDVGTK